VPEPNGNSRGLSLQWVLGILIVILLAVQGYSISQVGRLDERVRAVEIQVSKLICLAVPTACLKEK